MTFRLVFTFVTALVVLVPAQAYTFESFVDDFDKSYQDPTEYAHREEIFYQNLATMERHNQQEQEDGRHGYTLGVNQYSDLLPSQVPMGYVKTTTHPTNGDDQLAASTVSRRRLLTGPDLEAIITTEPVSDLPKHVDWRQKGVSTPVKNQMMCGSCWAFASTAVMESHVAIATGTLYSLSPQELVSCAKNPLHCGGTGGCQGSTAEIAMEYVRVHGFVEEWAFGYESSHGATVECTLRSSSSSSQLQRATSPLLRGNSDNGDDVETDYLDGAVAGIHAWAVLPRNNYTAVMNAIAKLGPVAVSVACSPWVSYKSGIYSGSLNSGKETDVSSFVCDHIMIHLQHHPSFCHVLVFCVAAA